MDALLLFLHCMAGRDFVRMSVGREVREFCFQKVCVCVCVACKHWLQSCALQIVAKRISLDLCFAINIGISVCMMAHVFKRV